MRRREVFCTPDKVHRSFSAKRRRFRMTVFVRQRESPSAYFCLRKWVESLLDGVPGRMPRFLQQKGEV